MHELRHLNTKKEPIKPKIHNQRSEHFPIELGIRNELGLLVRAVHLQLELSLRPLLPSAHVQSECVRVMLGLELGLVGNCYGVDGSQLAAAE